MLGIIVYFIIVYSIYFFVSIKRFDKEGHYKKKKKKVEDYEALPAEVKYFIIKYKVDLKKINLRSILKLIGILLAIEVVGIMLFVGIYIKKGIAVQILISTLLLFPIYLLSLNIIGKYFKKKGWIKNV